MTPNAYQAFVESLLARTGHGPEAVIPILQGLQRQYRFLPEDALRCVSSTSGLRLADLLGVASFYRQFRLQPAGRHTVCVCHGTACHVKGAENIRAALHRRLHIHGSGDTSPDGEFTVERVACLGCCTLAPVVQVEGSTYGHLTADTVPAMLEEYLATGHAVLADVDAIAGSAAGHRAEIRVGLGSCCMAKGSDALFHRLRATVADFDAPADVKRVGCVGMCHQTPVVEVRLPGGPTAFYARVGPADAEAIVRRHFHPRRLRRRLARWVDRTLTDLVAPPGDRQRLVHHAL
ncbi:MAG: NAD(P)H-dependent oxidoreductase subunit E, partial [Kiritimatiellaeota bacterium]|nr:NAD(P)H-dependent oxidoreductase subunit E [Kiritimatiellota bacterium]